MKGSIWLLFVVGLLAIFPVTVGAHSYVSESSPEDGEELAEAVDEIILQFNAGIEGVSTATVYDEAGQEVPSDYIEVESSTITVNYREPLVPGSYHVEWNALGEDTHHTKGSFLFTVLQYEIEGVEEETKLPESPEVELELDQVIDDSGQSELEEESSVELSAGRLILPLLITAIALFVFLRFFIKRRR
ncbi:copper resistance protein CopC [Halalkalibacter kiskunsagensis]|uniref:Copper resistance protein CopC n=1 Tax=Halalkalibacter kiskunsagensis TaxID=1548599 RepID=A0ABV6KFL6_9BACI